MEEKIKERVAELQREIQMHQQRANQAQQILNEETTQTVAKQGAILELKKLLEQPQEPQEKKIEEKEKEL